MPIDADSDKPTRVKIVVDEDGKKSRVAKSGAQLKQAPSSSRGKAMAKDKKKKKGDKAKKSADVDKYEYPEGYVPRMQKLVRDKQITTALQRQVQVQATRCRCRVCRRSSSTSGLGEAVQPTPSSSTPRWTTCGPSPGMQPVVRRARKSIAGFKLREGLPIGVKVTLRRNKMWEFADRLFNIALPRVRDFKGVSPKGFDGSRQLHDGREGADHLPRDRLRQGRRDPGMNISFRDDRREQRGRAASCCNSLGMPFRAPAKQAAAGERGQRLMARAQAYAKLNRPPKFSRRGIAIAARSCGRPRGYYRDFELCRICLRNLALRGRASGCDQSELVIRMVTDPIADMLSRIRNAITANHERTRDPASRLKMRVAEILKQEGYISDVREETANGHKNIEIVLKYGRNRKPAHRRHSARESQAGTPRLRRPRATSRTCSMRGHGHRDSVHLERRHDGRRGPPKGVGGEVSARCGDG